MSITDKITGRAKQAAGDLLDSAHLKREGSKEEEKGEAKERFARKEEEADREAQRVANLERQT
ncbi:hypothetical protein [Conexibacter sp. SYSU D00693]|uniref:hypothetical protein n=1 Tax=Conexibacter sp. SYSU D00693 TaxID=2812560 RepID=UPI00196B81CD|nr:hypothetical protein [Conexibacter sp. SYSU D00693]